MTRVVDLSGRIFYEERDIGYRTLASQRSPMSLESFSYSYPPPPPPSVAFRESSPPSRTVRDHEERKSLRNTCVFLVTQANQKSNYVRKSSRADKRGSNIHAKRKLPADFE